jgi:colanic acid biosynthesis glycosyl transferase WcaI
MKILLITQVFYPDTVSVSQHLTDLSRKLVEEGHDVTVYTSCFPYEEKTHRYIKTENFQGIKIERLLQTSFGKGNVFFRLFDFITFYFTISFKLLFVKRREFDVIIGTTVPPLLSFVGVLASKLKGITFQYWVMDLQPELSISSGLIRKNSLSAMFFTKLGNFIIQNATSIISLDRFMTNYLLARGAKKKSISTIPVWPVLDERYLGSRDSNPFRLENNFGDRVVIMYSGNHAYVHHLDTLLRAALELKDDRKFLFVFVGGGVRKKDVTDFKTKHHLENIVQLPFQPRENIHNSLGSADIHVVILGDGQVGYTHPNKVYGAMYIGKPILYIGPKESHVSDILDKLDGNISVSHDEYELLAQKIALLFSNSWKEIETIGEANMKYAVQNFHPELLKKRMLDAVLK